MTGYGRVTKVIFALEFDPKPGVPMPLEEVDQFFTEQVILDVLVGLKHYAGGLGERVASRIPVA